MPGPLNKSTDISASGSGQKIVISASYNHSQTIISTSFQQIQTVLSASCSQSNPSFSLSVVKNEQSTSILSVKSIHFSFFLSKTGAENKLSFTICSIKGKLSTLLPIFFTTFYFTELRVMCRMMKRLLSFMKCRIYTTFATTLEPCTFFGCLKDTLTQKLKTSNLDPVDADEETLLVT